MDLPSSETPLSDADFNRFSTLISGTCGIVLPPHKKGLVTSRLLKRLHERKIPTFSDYYDLVSGEPAEMVEMINSITTNVTQFFRENHHFVFLREHVLPRLTEELRLTGSLRIWSAGCATGMEPYTIAMTLLEFFRWWGKNPFSYDIKILATDISTKALHAGERGIYPFPDNLSQANMEVIMRYFLRGTGAHAGTIKAKNVLRELIAFRQLNFRQELFPFRRQFNVIFCRNVMIYFDHDMRMNMLGKFYRHMTDDGYLFLGHSETVLGFDGFRPVDLTVYRKMGRIFTTMEGA